MNRGKRKLLVPGLVLLAAAIAGYFYLAGRDERAIRRNVAILARAISNPAPGGAATEIARLRNLPRYFAGPFEFQTARYGNIPVRPLELPSMILSLRNRLGRFTVAVSGHRVEIAPDRDRARSVMTVIVRNGNGAVGSGEQEILFLEIDWQKADTAWLVAGAREIPVLY